MGMIKHGDGKIIESTETPEFTYSCETCGRPFTSRIGSVVPKSCPECTLRNNQEK